MRKRISMSELVQEKRIYELWIELGSTVRNLEYEQSFESFATTLEAINQLPDNERVVLRLFNTYYFDRLRVDEVDPAHCVFSEQPALRQMKGARNDREDELSRDLAQHWDIGQEEDGLYIVGESASGVHMLLCIHWDGMFLEHILLLSGDAVKVKELAKAVAI
jgi:hypothetical protein